MKRLITALFATVALATMLSTFSQPVKAVDARCDGQLQACQAVADVNYAICVGTGGWFCGMKAADEVKACMFANECYVHE